MRNFTPVPGVLMLHNDTRRRPAGGLAGTRDLTNVNKWL